MVKVREITHVFHSTTVFVVTFHRHYTPVTHRAQRVKCDVRMKHYNRFMANLPLY